VIALSNLGKQLGTNGVSLFSIKSSSSDTELVFSAPEKDYFTVEFKSDEVRAIRKVYAYSPHSPGLVALFGRIANQNRPWASAECWGSLEGEFTFSATCSNLGAVTFSVAMLGRLDARDKWRISANVTADLGQLSSIAAKAEQFFGVVDGT
jgi:hypothetical protein